MLKEARRVSYCSGTWLLIYEGVVFVAAVVVDIVVTRVKRAKRTVGEGGPS